MIGGGTSLDHEMGNRAMEWRGIVGAGGAQGHEILTMAVSKSGNMAWRGCCLTSAVLGTDLQKTSTLILPRLVCRVTDMATCWVDRAPNAARKILNYHVVIMLMRRSV